MHEGAWEEPNEAKARQKAAAAAAKEQASVSAAASAASPLKGQSLDQLRAAGTGNLIEHEHHATYKPLAIPY